MRSVFATLVFLGLAGLGLALYLPRQSLSNAISLSQPSLDDDDVLAADTGVVGEASDVLADSDLVSAVNTNAGAGSLNNANINAANGPISGAGDISGGGRSIDTVTDVANAVNTDVGAGALNNANLDAANGPFSGVGDISSGRRSLDAVADVASAVNTDAGSGILNNANINAANGAISGAGDLNLRRRNLDVDTGFGNGINTELGQGAGNGAAVSGANGPMEGTGDVSLGGRLLRVDTLFDTDASVEGGEGVGNVPNVEALNGGVAGTGDINVNLPDVNVNSRSGTLTRQDSLNVGNDVANGNAINFDNNVNAGDADVDPDVAEAVVEASDNQVNGEDLADLDNFNPFADK